MWSYLKGSQEVINEETMQEQQDISDVDRINKRMLEMQEELIELLRKEGKIKESNLTTENRSIEENTTMLRIFRQERSTSPFSRPIASSAPFTS
ncbi:hypothetical protein O181_041492 [Austropuccinia psidii MF-1]|uniref:Uncharacterized protein n=1 Tax=Austropuccinia psidii MF-1 TaxID=1389203 RepID=A0A9Q3HEW7_9BASI|nr:hypothetical protein [Austropuccinia psidii MF-1]